MTRILNLGCGTKTSPLAENIDWSIYQRLKANCFGRAIAPVVLRGARLDKFRKMDAAVVVHDLRTGIPAEDQSVDAVYHSHILEHIDRNAIPGFMAEIRRVLRPDGIHRIVVPDLEALNRSYLTSLEAAVARGAARREHDTVVATMIEQMVRREPFGTSQQPRLRRRVENLLLGDARKRGETHMWMWDRVSLSVVLEEAGFHSVEVVDYRSSGIKDWSQIGLDLADDGAKEYKPGSLYVEARR